MKALGKRSLSSVLLVLVNIGWYCVSLALVVTLSFIAVGSNVGLQIDADGAPSVDVGAGVKMTIPVTFSIDSEQHRVSAPSLGIPDAHIQDARASLRFMPVKGAFFLTSAMLLVALLGIILWVLGELRALFRTLRDGQPFVAANAARIRRIGYAAIIGELARSAVVFSENYYAMTHFTAEGLHFSARPDLNVFTIVNGLIILAIAEVFRIGARLDEDQSLTV